MQFVFTTPPACSRTTMIPASYSCCQGDSKCGVKCEYDDANSRESSRTYHPSAAPSPYNQENHNHHNHRCEGYTSPQVVGQHPSPEFVLNEQIKHEYQESLRSDLSEMGSENQEFSVQSNPTESDVNAHAFGDPSLFERYDTFRLKKDYVEGLEEDRELPIPDAPRVCFTLHNKRYFKRLIWLYSCLLSTSQSPQWAIATCYSHLWYALTSIIVTYLKS